MIRIESDNLVAEQDSAMGQAWEKVYKQHCADYDELTYNGHLQRDIMHVFVSTVSRLRPENFSEQNRWVPGAE